MLDSFETISPTALVSSYVRSFTDIPYEKEIHYWLKNNCSNNLKDLDKRFAIETEARYKLINKLLNISSKRQVIELAAGYTSRGLIYSQKGYNYVEMDLEGVVKNKNSTITSFTEIPSNLNIIAGNALSEEDFRKCQKYLKNEETAVINEGLLRYLTFEEKRLVAQNIYGILKKYGGVWITCDVTPKKFIQKQNDFMPKFNKDLNSVTSRNNLNDRFEDVRHIKRFMKEIGFNDVEVHKFIEVKDEISSFENLGVDRNSADEVLENGIVAVIRI